MARVVTRLKNNPGFSFGLLQASPLLFALKNTITSQDVIWCAKEKGGLYAFFSRLLTGPKRIGHSNLYKWINIFFGVHFTKNSYNILNKRKKLRMKVKICLNFYVDFWDLRIAHWLLSDSDEYRIHKSKYRENGKWNRSLVFIGLCLLQS